MTSEKINELNNKWPVCNPMWQFISNGLLEDTLRHLNDCAVNVGVYDHLGVSGYYNRCEYKTYWDRRHNYYDEDTMAKFVRSDPWFRDFVCFPHQPELNTINRNNEITYKYEPVYKHNRTVIVGYLINTSIDGQIVWCLDLFKSEVE